MCLQSAVKVMFIAVAVAGYVHTMLFDQGAKQNTQREAEKNADVLRFAMRLRIKREKQCFFLKCGRKAKKSRRRKEKCAVCMNVEDGRLTVDGYIGDQYRTRRREGAGRLAVVESSGMRRCVVFKVLSLSRVRRLL